MRARPCPQRADCRAGLRIRTAPDLRRDLPSQCDRVVANRSWLPHGRHRDDRARQRAHARRDGAGDCGRIHNYGDAALRPGLLDQHAGTADTSAGKKNVPYKFVSGAYFDVMGIPILRGRSFTAAEREVDAVVIVSESTARMLWPNRDAVGETFRLEPDMNSPTQPGDEPPLPSRMVTVVGVSRDVTGFRFTGAKGSMVSADHARFRRPWPWRA